MKALAFWKTVTVDEANLLEQFVSLLNEKQVRYCLIGGQAVNAYVEPVVSLDLDVVVAVDDLERLASPLAQRFQLERFAHSLNVSLPASDLRVQIQLDPRYSAFVERASNRNVLGIQLPVARLEDVLQGKIWAAEDPTCRGSKRQKDLADAGVNALGVGSWSSWEFYSHSLRNAPGLPMRSSAYLAVVRAPGRMASDRS